MSRLVNSTIFRYIKQTMPGLYSVIRQLYWYSRKQAPVTKIFGPKWQRSRKLIEIYITYRCNLNCYNCDISCRQAPSKEHMTPDQIKKFIKESKDNNIKWEKIRVMGGEPTLHPGIHTILNMLLEYKRMYSPDTRIQLITNGFGKLVKDVLNKVPEGIEIENSEKKSPDQKFTPFNVAPKDNFIYRFTDYSNGCPVIAVCGIGLTPYGYYCCGVAGSIDRVFGFDTGRKKMPDLNDSMADQLDMFCKYCGHFIITTSVNSETMSRTWETAYDEHKKGKIRRLTYYD